LNPLQREEAFEYIDHKLRESGGSTKEIFGKRAIEMLVDPAKGFLVNSIFFAITP
jgi:type II secretory pathway predicted ATPase ExeA